jgi:hypothetical protein
MNTFLKIPTPLLQVVKHDLSRSHPFAFERVGFLMCKQAKTSNSIGIFAYKYVAIPDDEYIEDSTIGAMIGADALRRALILAFNSGARNISVFHVHEHFGTELPWFSDVDLRESAKFIPDFFNAAPNVPHGTLVLNKEHISGQIWTEKESTPCVISVITNVGVSHIISRQI